MTDFDVVLQLDVRGAVAIFKEAVDAFKDDEVFRGGEVAGLVFVDRETLGFGIDKLPLGEVGAHFTGANQIAGAVGELLGEHGAGVIGGEAEAGQGVSEMGVVHGLVAAVVYGISRNFSTENAGRRPSADVQKIFQTQ